ncbi:hypothetical protein ACFYUH_34805 [Streptomyces fimicarius]|uniref:hypothetical protein n=1 Tax=Streptomyces griseus TaxID=1911 RepID=UPI00369A97ED
MHNTLAPGALDEIPHLGVAIGLTDTNTGAPVRKARYPCLQLLWMLGLWASSVGAGLLRAWNASGAERVRSSRLTGPRVRRS